MPEWMKWIKHKMKEYDSDCDDDEIYRTFNCGYGMLVVVDKQYANMITAMQDIGIKVDIIGSVVKKEKHTNLKKVDETFSRII